MKLGVQLFGCAPLLRDDPEAFLRKLKEMGYDLVEPCVSFGGLSTPFSWDFSALPEYKAMTDRLGLDLDSCHAFAKEFWNCVPDMAEAARIAGFKRFVVGWRGEITRENVEAFARHCAETAAALSEHGLELWLHNNAQEIAGELDGVSVYEWVLRYCKGSLGAQVDTGWVVCGGRKLKDYLDGIGEYVRSIHHKDVAALTDANGRTDNVALGKGIVDTEFAFRMAQERGLSQIVDQDNSLSDFADDLRQSVVYLRSL